MFTKKKEISPTEFKLQTEPHSGKWKLCNFGQYVVTVVLCCCYHLGKSFSSIPDVNIFLIKIRVDYTRMTLCIRTVTEYIQTDRQTVDHIYSSHLPSARYVPDLQETSYCVSRGVSIIERKYGGSKYFVGWFVTKSWTLLKIWNVHVWGTKCTVASDGTHILARVLLQSVVIMCGNNRLVSGILQSSVAILSVLSIS